MGNYKSVPCHAMGHAVVGIRFGYQVVENMRQIFIGSALVKKNVYLQNTSAAEMNLREKYVQSTPVNT